MSKVCCITGRVSNRYKSLGTVIIFTVVIQHKSLVEVASGPGAEQIQSIPMQRRRILPIKG